MEIFTNIRGERRRDIKLGELFLSRRPFSETILSWQSSKVTKVKKV